MKMQNKIIDQPQSVRKEDGLDAHKLSVYLANNLDNYSIKDSLKIKQYPGGASNLTYLLQCEQLSRDVGHRRIHGLSHKTIGACHYFLADRKDFWHINHW